jgi:hypothetical protein
VIPRDILLGADGDIAVYNGDFVVATGEDAIKQAVRQTLQFWKGEFFGDTSLGFLSLDTLIGAKAVPDYVKTAAIKSALLGTPGIASVDVLTVTYIPETRSASVACSITAESGVVTSMEGIQLGAIA